MVPLRLNMSISPCRFFITEYHVRLITYLPKHKIDTFYHKYNSGSKVTKTLSAIAKNWFLICQRFQNEYLTLRTQQRNKFDVRCSVYFL